MDNFLGCAFLGAEVLCRTCASSFLLFGRSGAAKGRRFQASQNKVRPTPTPSLLLLAAAPSGCPLQCPAETGHGTCWSPPFKGARGDFETHRPPSISASIPNARSSKRLHVSRRSTQSPRSNILPRRDPPHTTLPRWFRCRSTIGYRYATANAVDLLPHRFSSFHREIDDAKGFVIVCQYVTDGRQGLRKARQRNGIVVLSPKIICGRAESPSSLYHLLHTRCPVVVQYLHEIDPCCVAGKVELHRLVFSKPLSE